MAMDSAVQQQAQPATKTYPGNVVVMTAAEVVARDVAEQDARDVLLKASNEAPANLAGYLWGLFQSAKSSRNTITMGGHRNSLTMELLNCEMQRRGEYSAEELEAMKKMTGCKKFVKLTDQKCNEAKSWIKEILAQPETPWKLEPLEEPSLSPELQDACRERVVQHTQRIMEQLGGEAPDNAMVEQLKYAMHDELMESMREQAQESAKRMSRKISTQLADAGFDKEIDKLIDDYTTFPYAWLKATVRMRDVLGYEWQQDRKWKVVRKREPRFQIERVSPFDMFISPNMTDVNSGYIFERMRCTRADLVAMKGVAHYRDDMIDGALRDFGVSGRTEWVDMEWQKKMLEGRIYTPPANSSDVEIDVLEFHGSAQGRLLKEWGIDADGLEDLDEYETTALVIGNYVIKAVIENDMGMRPYFAAAFYPMPDTVWGEGIPQKMRTEQGAMNLAWRSFINNMVVSSGPQGMVDTRFISGKEGLNDIHPFKMWFYQSKDGQSGGKPIDFFVPPSVGEQLMKQLAFIANRADLTLDIPSYQSGANVTEGAGSTAKGLQLLMSASGKTIENAVKNLDDRIIVPLVEWLFRMNMLYSDDEFAKGPLNVKVNGMFNMKRESDRMQQLTQFANMAFAPGSIFGQMIGRGGSAALMRPIVETLKLPKDIVPSPDKLAMQDELDRRQQEQAAKAEQAAKEADANLRNQKAVSENTGRQQRMMGSIANQVQTGIMTPEEGRMAVAQTSNLGAQPQGQEQEPQGQPQPEQEMPQR